MRCLQYNTITYPTDTWIIWVHPDPYLQIHIVLDPKWWRGFDVCCWQFANDTVGVSEVLHDWAMCQRCMSCMSQQACTSSLSVDCNLCRQFANDIEGVLEMLPHKEGDVLALRYGLFNGEPKSLRDAANLLKMSTEGVRKSELTAFRYGETHILDCTAAHLTMHSDTAGFLDSALGQ